MLGRDLKPEFIDLAVYDPGMEFCCLRMSLPYLLYRQRRILT